MNSNATIRETTNNESKTVQEDGAQKTVRESASAASAPASIVSQKFRNYNILQQLRSSGSESDVYVVSKGTDKFILKLYRYGIEPKMEVINKIVSLSKSSPRELIHIFEFDFDEGTKRWFEIQEYAEKGSLKQLIDNIPKLGEKGRNTIFASILRQVSDSLKLLHENGILHLDLKPANVLVRSLQPIDFVLIDFGISNILDSDLSKKFTAVRGTPMYQSPESWSGAIGKPSDWWSLGMLALEIANGKHPFEGLSQQLIASLLMTKQIEIPEKIPPDKKEILQGLLTRDMSKRWSYDQVSRWLGGERNIPVYFEKSVTENVAISHSPTHKETPRTLSFMGEKHTGLETLARSIVTDETSWAKGRELLMRGNIRTWLESNGEFEQAIDIDSLVEEAEDPDEKLFIFVHFYGKPLPFVFMGKAITFNNLYLFLGRNLRREEQSKTETIIAEKFCDGKLSFLLDFYLRHNESNDEFAGLKQIFSRIQGKKPQAVFEYLNVVYDIQKSTPLKNSLDQHGRFRKAVEGYDEEIKRRIAEEKRREEERIAEANRNLQKIRKSIAKFQGCISACIYHTVGLKTDGTVVAVGHNEHGQCNFRSWRDIVAISAGYNHTIGLKADDTVVAVGCNKYGQCNINRWRDIIAISAGYHHTVGLTADGTVVAVGHNEHGQCNFRGWRYIVAISAGSVHTVGLKTDGTVVAVGQNKCGKCNVEGWRDIVAISTGSVHTVGLKADDTVVAVGYNKYGQCNVEGWRDIIAISAGNNHTVGLKTDGTVVAVGNNRFGRCDTEDWRNIVAISADYAHTIGLKADGTVVAVGNNEDGRCNTEYWRGIGPAPKEQFKKRLLWKTQGLCENCGGQMSGLFFKKCKTCGSSKGE